MLVKRNASVTLRIAPGGAVRLEDTRAGKMWEFRNSGWIRFGGHDAAVPLGTPRLEETAAGAKMRFESKGLFPFTVETELCLSESGLEILVNAVEAPGFTGVEYPAHLFSFLSGEGDSYLAVPYKQGTIVPGRLDAGFMRFLHNTWRNIADIDRTLPFESPAVNMTWFGAKHGDSSLFGYMETPEDSSLHVVGNAVVDDGGLVVDARQGTAPGTRICSLTPVWNASRGALGYTRRMRVEAVSGGYVGMAKRYQQLSMEAGRYVSLREKIERNPEAARLIGAPDIKIYIYTNRPDTPYYRSWSDPVLNGYTRVHTTFGQVGEMARGLKEAGVDNALILLGGWNRMGYDREHIDMLPAAEPAGGTAGLAAAAQQVLDLGYVFALHDNYQDIYLDSPSYSEDLVMKHPDGSVKLGGVWDGGLCRLVCSRTSLELIRKTVEELLGDVPVSSYYLDTITSACLYECYDENHPLTRRDDKAAKLAVLDYLIGKGLIAGGEAGIDWAVSRCPYFEGLPGDAVGYFSGIDSPGFGIAAPLFNLVYHDAVVCYWQHGQPFGREDHENHLLHDLLSGQPSSWSLVYDQWADLLPLIRQSHQLLGGLHRKTAFHELLTHDFLTDDFAVQQSAFSDGTQVIVNYGITTYHGADFAVPPKGFRIRSEGEPAVTGGFNRLAEIQQTSERG